MHHSVFHFGAEQVAGSVFVLFFKQLPAVTDNATTAVTLNRNSDVAAYRIKEAPKLQWTSLLSDNSTQSN